MKLMETTVVVGYLIIMILIGIYFSKKAHSSEQDYWVAGRRIGSFVGAFAIFSAAATGSSFYGSIGAGITYGLPYYLANTLGAVGLFTIALFLFAAPMRRAKVFTLPEYFLKRYGPTVHLISALLVILAFTVYLMPQFTTSGYVMSYLIGIPYPAAVILVGVGVAIYAAIGGMWAITFTDLIQGLLMTIGSLILAVFVLAKDNFYSLIQTSMEVDPSFMEVTQPFTSYLGIFFIFLVFGIASPTTAMRSLSAKSTSVARRTMMGGSILYFLLFTFGLFILLAAVNLNLTDLVENNDLIFLNVIEYYLPPVLAGIILSAILASIMSSTDAFLLAVSAGVARDIYKGFINKKAEEGLVTKIGLIVIFLTAGIGVTLALNPPQLIVVMSAWVTGGIASVFLAPVVLGLWWKRANLPGAMAGMIGGFVSYCIALILPTGVTSEIIFATPISFILMIVVSLVTREPSAEIQREVEQNHIQ